MPGRELLSENDLPPNRPAWVAGGLAVLTVACSVWAALTVPYADTFLGFVGPLMLAACSFFGCLSVGIIAWSVSAQLRLLRTAGPLARWVIDGPQWQAFAQRRRAAAAKRRRSGFAFFAAVMVVGAVASYALDPVDGPPIAYAFVVAAAGVGMLAVLSRLLEHRLFDTRKSDVVVLVGSWMAVLGRGVVSWGGAAQRVTDIALDQEQQVIVISGRPYGNQTMQSYRIELPYPESAEDEARGVVETLRTGFGVQASEP